MNNNELKIIQGSAYVSTLKGIKKRVHEAKYKAFQKVNTQLIGMYWDIGRIIYKKQKTESWGNNVIEALAKDLQQEFPGVKGFSGRNISDMRKFFIVYRENVKVRQLVAQIGWSHNIMIMQKCKDGLEREYYIRMVIKQGWSRSILKEMIESRDYERWAINQSNFKETLLPNVAQEGEILLKDEYNLSFLEIDDNVKEKEIENKIMENIIRFLQEMGGDMMFVGRQFRLEFEDQEYFIDLLFYHKRLRSYVILELKANRFKPEHTGKMAMYLSVVEERLRDIKYDNPAIGIILCKSKNRKLVDVSLKFITRPIGVATYKTVKKRHELPKDMQKYLPTKDQIIRKLAYLVQ